jgi:deoxyhypusine synthase
MLGAEFQRDMSSAELHFLLGKYLAAREDELGVQDTCVLTTAYRCGVPCYTSSPGDSSIGMNVAELSLRSRGPRIDVSRDVNETAAIVYEAKQSGGTSSVLILGGGSPKNFVLQTEPHIQEVLGLPSAGHDYFVQVTDARPDTGGLSGATPSEAVSWGKVDPDKLPDSVVVYGDTTVVLPLLVAYALSRHEPRPLRRLYDARERLLDALRRDFVGKGKA